MECKTEVEELEGAVHITPHNVGRLEVGMHVVGAVQRIQGTEMRGNVHKVN